MHNLSKGIHRIKCKYRKKNVKLVGLNIGTMTVVLSIQTLKGI